MANRTPTRVKRTFAGALIVALAAVGGALGAGSANLNGTWRGTITELDELHYRPAAKLVVGPVWVTAEFTGLTGAAHDAPTATTTCSVRYRFKGRTAKWRYYLQVGKPRLTSAGYVQNSPCSASPSDELLRIRLVARGVKLLVEFQPGGQFNDDLELDFIAGSRALLHR